MVVTRLLAIYLYRWLITRLRYRCYYWDKRDKCVRNWSNGIFHFLRLLININYVSKEICDISIRYISSYSLLH